jgi:hypothetical protein
LCAVGVAESFAAAADTKWTALAALHEILQCCCASWCAQAPAAFTSSHELYFEAILTSAGEASRPRASASSVDNFETATEQAQAKKKCKAGIPLFPFLDLFYLVLD